MQRGSSDPHHQPGDSRFEDQGRRGQQQPSEAAQVEPGVVTSLYSRNRHLDARAVGCPHQDLI
jgi:hypothetical protein